VAPLTPLRLFDDESANKSLSELLAQYDELKAWQSKHASGWQDLALAYAAGCLSLVALLGLGRFVLRHDDRPMSLLRQELV